ncbi:unnamed protein product [Miscanthus lutarioriparius]|uniref:Uncharacterized protein n=1 Tax=Miscanthus lutarioriparius TaxID=422564 RepID=A0A811QRX3_9POAL|nr:unnamed protein product [Miscanthus lutarioriparius]
MVALSPHLLPHLISISSNTSLACHELHRPEHVHLRVRLPNPLLELQLCLRILTRRADRLHAPAPTPDLAAGVAMAAPDSPRGAMALSAFLPELGTQVVVPVAAIVGIAFAVLQRVRQYVGRNREVYAFRRRFAFHEAGARGKKTVWRMKEFRLSCSTPTPRA